MPSTSLFSSLDEYVKNRGGKRTLKKILISNNGIGAVKCIRSIRSWAYQYFGDIGVVKFVAMATPEDLKANAEYIRMADHFERVPGGSNNNNYANVSLIVELAQRNECDVSYVIMLYFYFINFLFLFFFLFHFKGCLGWLGSCF